MLAAAIAAHQAGKMAEAEQQYRDFLQQQPQHADACALLGTVVGARGDFAEAIVWVDKAIAIDPASGLLHFHRGTVLMAAQKLSEAIAAFTRAAELQPNVPQIHFNFANALRAVDDWPGAITHYRESIKLDPNFLAAYNNLALSLVHEEHYKEAFHLASRTVALDASYGDGWLTLCNVAEKIRDYETALTAGERAVALIPDNHFAWFGYGVALNRLNRDEEAIEAYQKALQLNPARADICDNLAQSYQALNRLEEAEAAFREAIKIDKQEIAGDGAREIDEAEYGHRHWHLALIELLCGDYKTGFARYRARMKAIPELKRPDLPFPLWKGEDLRGKTILVGDEQGFGDTLMLARFLPMLRVIGSKIFFRVQKPLKTLFDVSGMADEVIAHGDKIPLCDFFCSSFDLPHRLGITLKNLPNATPYLPVLPPDADTLLPCDARKKIGIVWGGSPLHKADAKRSIPLPLVGDLFSVPNTQFYSFNRDFKPGDEERLKNYPIENLAPRLTDFAVAARLIGQMDLVISCDTATAHLAGALGKKTWVLLPFAPDWRWLTGHDDNPWYPTMRLFRQPKAEDWQRVIEDVRMALAKEFA